MAGQDIENFNFAAQAARGEGYSASMTTPSKPPPKPAAKATAKPTTKPATKLAAKPAARAATKPAAAAPAKAAGKGSTKALPHLRFYHSEALRTKTLVVLAALEEADDPTEHRDALAKLVVELNDAGMDYCFIKPLKLAKPGFLVEQSASLGMAGALQVIGSVVRNIIGRMQGPQLLSVSASIRQLIL